MRQNQQQTSVSINPSSPSPTKPIKQRQRQKTLNEQLDLLDRQFCVEVDSHITNRMGTISFGAPSSRRDTLGQQIVRPLTSKMFSKSLDGVFSHDEVTTTDGTPSKTSRPQNFFLYYSPNSQLQQQPTSSHESKSFTAVEHSFMSAASSSVFGAGTPSTQRKYSQSGELGANLSSCSKLVLMPATNCPENMGNRSTAFLIKNESSIDSQSAMDGSVPEINKIIFESQESVYSLFMKAHKCYDIIPTSSKLVVFDTELPVSKAFFALVYNGVRAAPLWDSSMQDFVGMLTITDFIQILNKYYKNDQIADGMRQLEEHKISTWREIFKADDSLKPFITVDPTESLFRAVQLLCSHKIHRLPVMEHTTGNILYILTHKRIIKFLYLYINDLPRPAFMEKTPKELGIGSWENICTISKDTPLIEAMKMFLSKRVSALPLLDKDGRLTDIYAKFDAINLAADKTYDKLDVSVYEALNQRSDWFEGVRKCSDKDSLIVVIDALVKAEVHRLVVVDDDNRPVGIISLSDVLRHLILDLPEG